MKPSRADGRRFCVMIFDVRVEAIWRMIKGLLRKMAKAQSFRWQRI